MLATAVAYPLETADVTGSALSGLPGPAERHFSASSSSTATTTTSTTNSTCYSNATTATIASSSSTAAAHPSDGAVEHSPPVYANMTDAFGSQLPGQLPPANVPLQLPPQLALSLRRRRSSKLSMVGGVRRTASSPNVRALAGGDAAAVPYPNTKGRNKLGYHRTSVACGHCRRRKIRCLLAPGDEQGRCQNCIRLKKECNFFPVDQQQATARPPPLGLKPDPGDSSSASPSPPNHHGFASEHAAPFHPFSAEPAAPGSAPAPLGYPTPADARTRPGSVSSVGKPTLPLVSTSGARPSLPHMPTAPPSHSAGFNAARPDRPAGWEGSPYMDQSPMSSGPKLEHPAALVWKLADPMGPTAPPYSAPHSLPMIQHRESVSAYPYAMHREEVAWPVPTRSMSYSQLESLGVGQSGGYPASQEFKHPPPTALYPPPHPPPLPFRPAHFPPTPEPVSAPPDGRPSHGGYAIHPPWNPSYTGNTIGGMSEKSAEGYGGWFSESSRLSQVEEEVSTGPMNEDAPSFYHHGTAQSAT